MKYNVHAAGMLIFTAKNWVKLARALLYFCAEFLEEVRYLLASYDITITTWE